MSYTIEPFAARTKSMYGSIVVTTAIERVAVVQSAPGHSMIASTDINLTLSDEALHEAMERTKL